MHEGLGSLSGTEDVLLVDSCLAILVHAEEGLQLCLCYGLPFLLLNSVKQQKVLLCLKLVLQAIEVDRLRAGFGLPHSQCSTECAEAFFSLLVSSTNVKLH